jgi:hypothetical protein
VVAGEEQAALTLTQLRRLAAFVKRTPSALLLAKPPARHFPALEFRRPPGEARRSLNPIELRYIREANRIQRIIGWVVQELHLQITQPRTTVSSNIEEVAEDTRARLAFPLPLGLGNRALRRLRSGGQRSKIGPFLSSSCRLVNLHVGVFHWPTRTRRRLL